MEETSPTRQELRAIFADPESTREQKLQAKLFLAKRIARGSEAAVREACERYCLTPEQSEKLMEGYQSRSLVRKEWAAKEVEKIEAALAELHGE